MAFDRGERTYHLSDERLQAFRALPTEDKLRWVEELAVFIRLTRATADWGTDAQPARFPVARLPPEHTP